MSPDALAALHAQCFTTPRPWTAAEFAGLLSSGCTLLTAPGGFLLGRVAGGEGELLTLAVAPTARRAGQGGELVRRFLAACVRQDAEAAFLEEPEVAAVTARQVYAVRDGRLVGDALVLALDGAELCFACAPVGALPDQVRGAMDAAGPDCVVSDVGSTKGELAAVMRAELPRLLPEGLTLMPVGER